MKMNVKELRELLEKSVKKVEAAKVAVDEAAKGGDQAVIDAATKSFEAASAERKSVSDRLQDAVAAAKEDLRIENLLNESKGLTGTVVPEGADLSGGSRQSATAVDHDKKELEQRELFIKFFTTGGERMADKELDALQPKNKDLVKDQSGVSAVIPKSLMKAMFPSMFAKALPMTSHDNDAAGGRANLLYPQYGTAINQLPTENPSVFDRVTKKSVVGGVLIETRLKQDAENEFGGVEVQWVDEETNAPETEIEIEKITINCHPVKAYTSFTRTLFSRDRFGIEAEIVDKFKKALYAAFDYAIVNGSGQKQPLGIRVADGIKQIARATGGKVTYADLVKMKHGVLAHHRNGATWIMSDDVLAALEGTLDTTNRPIFNSSVGAGPTDRLLNYPYFVTSRCSSLGTIGDLIYGNLAHYWFAIEEEIAIARSEHAEFRKGGIAYRLDALAGGRPMYEKAFDILSGTGVES